MASILPFLQKLSIRHRSNTFFIKQSPIIKKLFSLLFLLSIAIGCDSEASTPDNIPNEPTEELDTTPPTINLQGIDEVIELRTTLDISIQDASDVVSTVVMINGEEVLTSSEKRFTYTLNPFEFPIGETTLTITSTDEANNENVRTYAFELKKLLFKENVGRSSESADSYLAINLESTGELIAYRKIITDDDLVFYASDEFEEQNLIVTNYILDMTGFATIINSARSTGGILPGTVLLTGEEVRNVLDLEPVNSTRNSQFDITIEGASYPLLFSALGADHNIGNRSSSSYGSSYTLTLDYNQETTNDIFLYYNNQSSDDLFANYRYKYIENFTNQTLMFEELSTIGEEAIVTLGLPNLVERFSTRLLGYSGDRDYRQGNFRLLFSYGRTTQESGFFVEYPNLSEYPVQEIGLDLDLIDGRTVGYTVKNLSEVTIPDLTAQKTNDIITVNGEYDFLSLQLTITEDNQGNDLIFNRTYKNTYQESLKNPFDDLEIPSEIMEYLVNQGLSTNSIENSGEMTLILTRYENQFDYPNGPFYFPLGREVGDIINISFPLDR